MPFVVVAAFALSAVTGGDSTHPSGSPSAKPVGTLTAAAPAQAGTQAANCTKVLQQLPVSLDGLNPRIVHTTPDTPFVVAWGDPAIVLSCGVDRPKALVPGSGVEFRGPDTGPFYDLRTDADGQVFTTVDRAAYIAIRFEKGVQPADHLAALSTAIARALPAVCSTDSATPDPAKLCTRRK